VTKPESEQYEEETPKHVETVVNSEQDSKSNQDNEEVNSIPEPAPVVVVPAAEEVPVPMIVETVKTDASQSDKVVVERTAKISEPVEVVSESKKVEEKQVEEKPVEEKATVFVVEKTPEPVKPVEKMPPVVETPEVSAPAECKYLYFTLERV
jgi:hypothetical protein